MKAGDTWTNETLVPCGTLGGYDWHTYDTTWASTYSASLSTYQGGSVGSTYNAIITAAGSAQGATDANEYCRRRAQLDSAVAARDAAQAASTWMEISSYGAGANPVIDGTGTASFGVNFYRNNPSGWKVSNLEIKNCIATAIHLAVVCRGMWITGCSLHDCQNPTGNPIAGYDMIPFGSGPTRTPAMGLYGAYVTNLFVDNCAFDNNDAPFLIGGLTSTADQFVDTCSANGSVYQSALATTAKRQVLRNLTLTGLCATGQTSGSCAMFLDATIDAMIVGGTYSNTPLHGSDGMGIDLEENNVNTLFYQVTASGNAAGFMMDFDNGANRQNSGTMIDGCTSTNNGIGYAANSQATFCRGLAPPGRGTNRMLLTRNTITRPTSPAQTFLFGTGFNANLSNTVTTLWTTGLFGADNTVS